MNRTALTSKPVPRLFMVQRMAAQMFSAGEAFPATWILTSVILHYGTNTDTKKLENQNQMPTWINIKCRGQCRC